MRHLNQCPVAQISKILARGEGWLPHYERCSVWQRLGAELFAGGLRRAYICEESSGGDRRNRLLRMNRAY